MSLQSPINFDLHSNSTDTLHLKCVAAFNRLHSNIISSQGEAEENKKDLGSKANMSLHDLFLPVLCMTSSNPKKKIVYSSLSRVFQSFNKISSTHDGISKSKSSQEKETRRNL